MAYREQGGGSASIPATSNVLKGAGSAGSATAATPGTDYITPSPGGANQTVNQTSGSTLGVTNLNKVFYVSGFPSSCSTNEGSFTTQLECAWFSVYDYAVANSAMVYLNMGYGYYIVNHSLYEPTQSFTGISLIGAGMQGSVILANATMTDAVIYKNETAAGGTWPQITFRDFKIVASDEAQGCMRLWGIQEPIVENINCISVPNGAPFLYQFGEPNNYAQGWVFQLKASNVIGGNTVAKPSTPATVTATVSGGNITGYVVSNGGAGYGAPSAEQIFQVYVLGNRNGTSDQPCAVMPTGLAATASGGVIQTVTQTGGGTGCSGTITVEVVPISNIAVGMDVWATDSMMDYLIPLNTLIGVINHSGNVNYNHVHPTQSGIGVQSTGNVTFNDTEIDSNAKWGFDFLTGTTSAKVDGTNTFNNMPALNMFHLAANATVQFGPQTDLCVHTTPADYHEFLMPYGTFEANGYLPAGSSAAPNDNTCSNLGSIFQQPVTLPAIAPATSGTPTYSSNPFTLSSSAWISSAVANHKWVWQANENTAGTYHYLTMAAPDPLNSEMDLAGNVIVQPTGTATASANFNSPQLGTNASWWNGTANQSTTFGLTLAPASGTNPAEVGTIGFSNCSSGGCTLQLPPLSAPVTAPGFYPQSGAAGPYSTFFDDFLYRREHGQRFRSVRRRAVAAARATPILIITTRGTCC